MVGSHLVQLQRHSSTSKHEIIKNVGHLVDVVAVGILPCRLAESYPNLRRST